MIEALERASGRAVPRETMQALNSFVDLLTAEAEHQNLIARSTIETVWQRHILDSAQLLRLCPHQGTIADIGSGAGLPGMVLAILGAGHVALVEPRRLRVEFLQRCVAELHLDNVRLLAEKAERARGQFDIITARAVAPIGEMLRRTLHLAHPGTRWILPKGQSGAKELAEAERAWQGRFWVEPSITEEGAVIVLAEGVKPRGGTSR